jgi:hypothetical protein
MRIVFHHLLIGLLVATSSLSSSPVIHSSSYHHHIVVVVIVVATMSDALQLFASSAKTFHNNAEAVVALVHYLLIEKGFEPYNPPSGMPTTTTMMMTMMMMMMIVMLQSTNITDYAEPSGIDSGDAFWNASRDAYSLHYRHQQLPTASDVVTLKCIPLGGSILLHAVCNEDQPVHSLTLQYVMSCHVMPSSPTLPPLLPCAVY